MTKERLPKEPIQTNKTKYLSPAPIQAMATQGTQAYCRC